MLHYSRDFFGSMRRNYEIYRSEQRIFEATLSVIARYRDRYGYYLLVLVEALAEMSEKGDVGKVNKS